MKPDNSANMLYRELTVLLFHTVMFIEIDHRYYIDLIVTIIKHYESMIRLEIKIKKQR